MDRNQAFQGGTGGGSVGVWVGWGGGCKGKRKSLINKVKFICRMVLQTHTLFFWGDINFNSRYRIVLPEELTSISETDLWKSLQKVSHCRYRFSVEFKEFPLQIQSTGSKQIDSVMISATTVHVKATCWIHVQFSIEF